MRQICRQFHGQIRIVSRIAWLMALFLLLTPPTGYALIQYHAINAEIRAIALIKAGELGKIVAANQGSWTSQTERLSEVLGRLSPDQSLEALDLAGHVVAASRDRISEPSLAVRVPIRNSDVVVGYLWVRHALHGCCTSLILSLAIGVVLAGAAFWILRQLPIAALRRSVTDLQRISDSKSHLLAAIGHDLRQPLQSLRLFSAVIGTTELAPKARKALDYLTDALDRTDKLLEAIMELGRIDAGIAPAKKTAVPLAPLFASLTNEMQMLAEAKGLRLRWVPCSATVTSDPVLLEAALRNLLANAIRYTDRGGVLLGCRHENGALRICVYDTGIGIDDDHLPRVFEEFYQVGNPERDTSKGIGLGLAIVSRMAEMMEHTVSVRSNRGKGSVFALTVPWNGAAA